MSILVKMHILFEIKNLIAFSIIMQTKIDNLGQEKLTISKMALNWKKKFSSLVKLQ